MGMAQPQRCDSIRPAAAITTNAPLKRLYQVWGGSNRFLLGGRLIFGPDARSLILTVFLIVSPVVLFCVFISQRLIHEFRHHLGNVIVAIPAVFTVYIIVLLLLTSGRDPGIIPRNRRPPEPDDEGDSSGLSLDWGGNQSSVSSLPVTKEVIVNGMVVKVKYCQTCMLYRPPRCSHCSICNNCVDRFDHHCPWVGQCIGKRNYRFFFMFVSSTTTLCIYVFAFCVINIMKIMDAYHCHLGKALGISPVSGILIIYTFIGAWFVGGLTFFHLYLICKNQTTYENFRYRYDGKRNPHNRGFFRNVGEIFFSKIPSSRIDFRAKVEDMPDILFSSVFSSSRSLGRTMSHKIPKTTVDLEVGDKRQAIGAEELDSILKRLDSVAGLERCGTQPLRANLGYKGNWEISSEVSGIQMLAT